MCREFGNVVSFRLPRVKKGRLKGIGFVEFETPEQREKARFGLQNKPLGNKKLRVEMYRKKDDSSHAKTVYDIF